MTRASAPKAVGSEPLPPPEDFIRRLVSRLEPPENADSQRDNLPPGVDKPYQPDAEPIPISKSGDPEELLRAIDNASLDVDLEVRFSDASCSDPTTLRERVDVWLKLPDPALDWRRPIDILENGDQEDREGLLEYLAGSFAGVECGVFS